MPTVELRPARMYLAAWVLCGCGLNIATLRSEHLPRPPAVIGAVPVDLPVQVTVTTAERYSGARHGGQVSVEADVIRDHVMVALAAHGVTNIVESGATARFEIEAIFSMVGIDGSSTRVGFTSTWVLSDANSREAIASTAMVHEESVPRIGWGKARFREAAARSIVKNTSDALEILLPALRSVKE